MRRILSILLVLTAFAAVTWLGLQAREISVERRQASLMRQTLPRTVLADTDDAPAVVGPADGRSTVLVFFTTTCAYCEGEIADLKRRAAAFGGAKVVLISPEGREAVRSFRRAQGLDLVPQFEVLRDTVPTLGARYRIRRVPTVLVYGPDGRLAGEFEGPTSVERILEAVTTAP